MDNSTAFMYTLGASSPYNIVSQVRLDQNGKLSLYGGNGTSITSRIVVLGNGHDYLGIDGEGWNSPTFSGSWTGACQYKIFPDGTVGFRGDCSNGSRTGGSLIFTLPSGYRPITSTGFIVPTTGATENKIEIGTNGEVRFWPIGTATGTLYVDCIRFTITTT